MNSKKKSVFIKGTVKFPLRIGMKAIIFHDGGIIRTPSIEMIKRITPELIIFETRNSIYYIAPYFAPEPAAMTANANILYSCA